MEIWKDIEGFEKRYQVSSWGRVRNKLTKGIVKPYVNSKGYLKVGLWYSRGKTAKFRVNRLVAAAFIPNPYSLPQVNHKDGNKMNNSITNLEWMTNEENQRHAMILRRKVTTQ